MNSTYRYGICDLVLISNIALPELTPASDGDVECQFELLDAGLPSSDGVEWFHQWRIEERGVTADGARLEDPLLQFGRCSGDYVLRFPSYGEFTITRNTKNIRCRPLPDTAEMTVRHLLLDQVFGFTRMGQHGTDGFYGQNIGLNLGIPGTNGPDPRQSGFPIFNITGYTSLGQTANWMPFWRHDQSWTTSHNMT